MIALIAQHLSQSLTLIFLNWCMNTTLQNNFLEVVCMFLQVSFYTGLGCDRYTIYKVIFIYCNLYIQKTWISHKALGNSKTLVLMHNLLSFYNCIICFVCEDLDELSPSNNYILRPCSHAFCINVLLTHYGIAVYGNYSNRIKSKKNIYVL